MQAMLQMRKIDIQTLMPMCQFVLNVGRPGVKLPDAEINTMSTFVEPLSR